MDWIGAVEREGHALSLTARHDARAEVPSCPGWNIDELLRHVGIAHHRVALILREGAPNRRRWRRRARPTVAR